MFETRELSSTPGRSSFWPAKAAFVDAEVGARSHRQLVIGDVTGILGANPGEFALVERHDPINVGGAAQVEVLAELTQRLALAGKEGVLRAAH